LFRNRFRLFFPNLRVKWLLLWNIPLHKREHQVDLDGIAYNDNMTHLFIEEAESAVAFTFSIDWRIYCFLFRNNTEVDSSGNIL